MSKPTVAFIIDTVETGGAERIASELAKAIDQQRFRKLLVVTRNCYATRLIGIDKFGVEVIQLSRSTRYDLRAYRELHHILSRVDIVHSHKDSSLLNAVFCSPIRNRPVMIGHFHTKVAQLGFVRNMLARLASQLCDRVLVVSALDLEEHVNRWNLDRRLFRVVHNGVDTKIYKSGNKIEARQMLGVNPNAYLIGSIGTINPYKGYEYLLDCAAIVQRSCGTVIQFLIAGHVPDTQYLQCLKDRAISLGISKNVTFLGHRRDVHEVLQALDLFVMPSVVECLPVALLEAMASAVPVVASAVGGIPEVLGNCEYGLLVPSRDSSALAAAIARYQGDSILSHQMSMSALNRIKSDFSIEAMARQVEAIYDELLAKYLPGRRCGSLKSVREIIVNNLIQ